MGLTPIVPWYSERGGQAGWIPAVKHGEHAPARQTQNLSELSIDTLFQGPSLSIFRREQKNEFNELLKVDLDANRWPSTSTELIVWGKITLIFIIGNKIPWIQVLKNKH
jgi:hypothetical protein